MNEAQPQPQRKTTEAQRRAQAKWNAANLERLTLSFKRGHREKWQAAADAAGAKTLSKWVIATLDKAAENAKPAE